MRALIAIVLLLLTFLSPLTAMTALASGDTADVSFYPGVLKAGDISISGFERAAPNVYRAQVKGFTVTDARGSGEGWSLLVRADAAGGEDSRLAITGTTAKAAPRSDAIDPSFIDANHEITKLPSAFVKIPAGGGKGTYYFDGMEILLTVPQGADASIPYSLTITIEVVSNTL